MDWTSGKIKNFVLEQLTHARSQKDEVVALLLDNCKPPSSEEPRGQFKSFTRNSFRNTSQQTRAPSIDAFCLAGAFAVREVVRNYHHHRRFTGRGGTCRQPNNV